MLLRWVLLAVAATTLVAGAAVDSHSTNGHNALSPLMAPENDWVDMEAALAPQAPVMRFATAKGEPNATVDPKSLADGEDPFNVNCMEVPLSVCMGNPSNGGTSMLAADAITKGLVGHWTFDDIAAQDSSGLLNSVRPPPPAAPGFLKGASAGLDGATKYVIKHHLEYDSNTFTVDFWLFLLHDGIGGFSTLLLKGAKGVSAPGINLYPDSRHLQIVLTTGEAHHSTFDSRAVIALQRWTHVALVVEKRIAQLFVNGILDVEYLLPNPVVESNHDWYLGYDPFADNGTPCYFDNLRIHNRALTIEELQATGGLAWPGIPTRRVRLGCTNCPLIKASRSCPEYYHLCGKRELSSGALAVARVMGWSGLENTVFWTEETVDGSGDPGTALCCRDPDRE